MAKANRGIPEPNIIERKPVPEPSVEEIYRATGITAEQVEKAKVEHAESTIEVLPRYLMGVKPKVWPLWRIRSTAIGVVVDTVRGYAGEFNVFEALDNTGAVGQWVTATHNPYPWRLGLVADKIPFEEAEQLRAKHHANTEGATPAETSHAGG